MRFRLIALLAMFVMPAAVFAQNPIDLNQQFQLLQRQGPCADQANACGAPCNGIAQPMGEIECKRPCEEFRNACAYSLANHRLAGPLRVCKVASSGRYEVISNARPDVDNCEFVPENGVPAIVARTKNGEGAVQHNAAAKAQANAAAPQAPAANQRRGRAAAAQAPQIPSTIPAVQDTSAGRAGTSVDEPPASQTKTAQQRLNWGVISQNARDDFSYKHTPAQPTHSGLPILPDPAAGDAGVQLGVGPIDQANGPSYSQFTKLKKRYLTEGGCFDLGEQCLTAATEQPQRRQCEQERDSCAAVLSWHALGKPAYACYIRTAKRYEARQFPEHERKAHEQETGKACVAVPSNQVPGVMAANLTGRPPSVAMPQAAATAPAAPTQQGAAATTTPATTAPAGQAVNDAVNAVNGATQAAKDVMNIFKR